MDPDLFNLWAWDLGVFKRPVAMETIQDGRQTQLFKKLKTPKSLHAD